MNRGRVLLVGAATAGLLLLGFQAVATQRSSFRTGIPTKRAPKSGPEITSIKTLDAAKKRFDGTVLGWRLAPAQMLESEGLGDRNLDLSCVAEPGDARTLSDLDFDVSYLPAGVTVENVRGPAKWLCNGKGLSVSYDYNLDTPYGLAELRVERAVWGRRALDLFVAEDKVESGTVGDRRAILVHPADDESGLGQGQIIVIEDDSGPLYTFLRLVSNDAMPLRELMKVAEGVTR